MARQVVMYLLRSELGLSLSAVGRFLDRRASTVSFAEKRIALRCKNDAALLELVTAAEVAIGERLDEDPAGR